VIKVGVVGGTGYTGIELLRLLTQHPQVEVECVTSRSEEGIAVSEVYPSLRGNLDCKFVTPDLKNLQGCDVVFFATPNGVAMKGAAALLEQGIKVVDLSADFRIKDVQLWSQWYGMEHASAELIEQANKRGTQLIDEAKDQARSEGERLKVAAQGEIEQEVNRAKESLRAQVAVLAVAGAEKILNTSVDQSAHSEMLEKLAAEL